MSKEDLQTSPSLNMEHYSNDINPLDAELKKTLNLKLGAEQFTPSNSPARRRKIEQVSHSPEEETVQTEDIPADIDMNKYLYNMLKSIKLDTAANKSDLTGLKSTVADIEERADKDSEVIMRLQTDLVNLALSNKIILGRLIRAEATIEQQAEEIVDMKTRSMRDNLIVKTQGETYKAIRNEDTGEKFKSFLKDELKIADTQNIKITRAHRMGRGNETNNAMMIAKLPYAQDQKKVFDNIAALKGTKHVITKQYPSEVEERRQFAWKAFKQAKASGHKAHFDHSGRLYIENKHITRFDPMPLPPVSAAVATSGSVEMPSGNSDIVFVNNHAFQAMIYKVKDYDGVREAKDRLLSNAETISEATHIPYAYRFATGTENYNSDRDFFGGTQILSSMRRHNIVDAVVFVLHFEPPFLITKAEKQECINDIVKAAAQNIG